MRLTRRGWGVILMLGFIAGLVSGPYIVCNDVPAYYGSETQAPVVP